jgi:endonuclease YncB( thermonuclease family)
MIRAPALVLVAMLVVSAAAAQSGAITVLDGDTVISNGRTYRLVGFDAPETGERAKCNEERILGGMARTRLQALINQGNVELTEVRCSCVPGTHGTRFCNYGRGCASLKVGGVDVGATLIAAGLARPFVCSKYRCPRRQGWCGEAPPVPGRV